MIRLLIDLSRYIFVLNLSIFLIIGYILLLKKEEKRSSILLFIQAFLIFMNHITGSFCLMASRRTLNFLVLPLVEIIIILSFIVLFQAVYPSASRLLTNDFALLLSTGLLVLTRLYYDKAVKQFVIICIGFLLCFFIPVILKHTKIWNKFGLIYLLAGICLLSSVFIKKEVVNGSMLNITLGKITFQPSELVKILFCVGLAAMLCNATKIYQYIIAALLSIIHVGILVATKDLGTAAIFYGTFIIVLFIASKKKSILAAGGLIAAISSYAAYVLFAHVRTRVAMWQNPWSDIDGKGYQTTQSLFAVCSGNLWGFGLDGGAPLTIPYVEEDFIFAAICEEFGAVFGCLFIFLCLHFFLETIKISKNTDNRFLHLTAVGMGFMYLIQIVLTIGGNINFIPMTGVTLNFTSYGGSSCLSSILMFAIVQTGAVMNNSLSDTNPESEILNKESNSETKSFEAVEKKKRIKYKSLLVLELLFSGLAAAMGIFLISYVNTHRVELVSNSYNAKRKEIIAKNIERGSIITRDEKAVAYSTTNANKTTRHYPFNNMYSHVVGYDVLGGFGVEKDFELDLMTSNISIEQWVDDDLKDEKHKGNTVVLTIDSRLQEAAFNALGIYDGAIVAMNPQTGEILCMVSKPDYNPNNIMEDWDKYIEDKTNSSLLNRVTSGLYPPGSTFKIMTALEYLKENSNVSNYVFNCNGYFSYDGNKIKCFHGSNHGSIDFETSFAKSCNSSFANIGINLDFDKFENTLTDLYFDKSLDLSFDTKVSTFGKSKDTHNVMQTAIGQGETLITPIHLAMITSTIANDGVMPEPYLVSRVESATGSILKEQKTNNKGQLLSSEEANKLKNLMIKVVEKGTATKLKDQRVKVAGKTGSAEFKTNSSDSHAWFTCFTYDTDYPIVVTVIVEDAGSGGEYAVPVARQILDVYYNSIIK